MNPDEIIYQAFASQTIQGEGFYVLEGHATRNEFRILAAEQAFKDNLNCFLWGIDTGFMYLGIYAREEHAQEYLEGIKIGMNRDLLKQSDGLFILEGNPGENELKIVNAADAFNYNMMAFDIPLGSGFVYMGVFTDGPSAQVYIDMIRKGIRNEDGDRLV